MARQAGERGFSAEERQAMKDRAAEMRAEARAGRAANKAEADLQDVLGRIAEMPDEDRALAEKVHAVVTGTAPELAARTWYGMPAYARDGKVVCYLQVASKFGVRYSTFGFNEPARLDDGSMWPVAYALLRVGKKEEADIRALVRRALG